MNQLDLVEPLKRQVWDVVRVQVREQHELGARDGLVHSSELAPRRVAKVNDVVKEGDQVKVKVLGVDDRGKVRLSMKVVDQETGEDISNKPADEASPAGE